MPVQLAFIEDVLDMTVTEEQVDVKAREMVGGVIESDEDEEELNG